MMSTRYVCQTKIFSSPKQVWKAITQENFAKHFFPEIKRDFSNINSAMPLYCHQNADKLLAAYITPGKTISWDTNANTSIRLIRNDLNANIRSIDIDIKPSDGGALVSLEVNYKPKLSSRFFQSHACVRNLFEAKLHVLKNDLETKPTAVECSAIYN